MAVIIQLFFICLLIYSVHISALGSLYARSVGGTGFIHLANMKYLSSDCSIVEWLMVWGYRVHWGHGYFVDLSLVS
jgi:hypothetical protein